MELKVAKTDLQSKKSETKISIDEVLRQYKEEGKHIFYFDGQNPHKDMQKATPKAIKNHRIRIPDANIIQK